VLTGGTSAVNRCIGLRSDDRRVANRHPNHTCSRSSVYLLIRQIAGLRLRAAAAGGGSIGLDAALVLWMCAGKRTGANHRFVVFDRRDEGSWWYQAGEPNIGQGGLTRRCTRRAAWSVWAHC
jgi:hypothetical protein